MTWEGLTPPYSTIVADPPWHYDTTAPGWRKGDERRALSYSTMTLDEIAQLNVNLISAPGAHLYLWTTNHHLERSYSVARSWGFDPTTTLVWCKRPKGLGPAGRFTVTTEFVIFATAPAERAERREVVRAGALIRAAREEAGYGKTALHRLVRGGKPTGIVYRWEDDSCIPTESDWAALQRVLPALANVERPFVPPPPEREPREVERSTTTWWEWPTGAHSVKPQAFMDIVEQVSPGPYVELFARAPRLGWDSWGLGYEGAA